MVNLQKNIESRKSKKNTQFHILTEMTEHDGLINKGDN